MQPLYVAEVAGRRVIRIGLSILAVLALAGCALVYASSGPDGRQVALINGAMFLIVCSFFFLVLPLRYEVWPDHLRVVLLGSRSWQLRFDTIAEARPARWWEAYGYFGVRFTTSPRTAVLVLRKQPGYFSNMNLVISPADRDEFLRRLDGAMAPKSPV